MMCNLTCYDLTGISAIQAPMRALYFPYREKQSLAQERILCVSSQGVEVYFLAHPDAEDPVTFTIPWEDILYVEPLRFSTKKYVFVILCYRLIYFGYKIRIPEQFPFNFTSLRYTTLLHILIFN